MGILTLVAIGALLVFLAIRSRRNPLFLAGAAAFLVLGRAIFIDITPWESVLSVRSLVVTTGDVVFAVVTLGWVYARLRRPLPCVRLAPVWAALGIVIVFFLALEVALTAASTSSLNPMLVFTSRDWFYIPLGYLMALDVLRRFSSDETARYIRVLSLFVVCASVLYIASAFNLPVYPYKKYLVTSFRGVTIIRDFSPIPFWVGLAWCCFLSQPRKGPWTYVAMVVVACGVLVTYTRWLLVALVVTAVLATILLLVRRGQRARGVIVGAVCGSLTILVLVLGPAVAPAQSGYLGERLALILRSGSVSREPNVQSRLQSFVAARAAGASVDSFFGAGLPAPSGSPYGETHVNADSDWIGIVYQTGLAGILVFAAPFGVALWRGARELSRREASTTATTLLLTGTLATAWFALWTLDSAFYLWWPAVSLLSVALVARADSIPAAVAAPVSNLAESSRERVRFPSVNDSPGSAQV